MTTDAPRRWTRWLPALLGLGLAAAGLLAFVLASQGLRITVAPPEAPRAEADPVALLRDDVAALQGQLDELGRAVGGGLEALDRSAAGRDELAARRVEALERRLEQALEQQRALAARLEARPEAAAPAGAAEAAPVTTSAPPEAAAAPPAPASAPAPAPPASRPGLFSFKAPGVDLDERLRFQVVPSLSRVGFDAKSTLHDFTGVTSDVEGWLEARLADPADGGAEIVARAATLRTGVDGRDEELRKRMETDRHPELRFVMRGFDGARVDREARTVSGVVRGDMTIHGVTRPLAVPVKASIDASRRLVLEGEVKLKMSDHGVDAPNLGVIVVQDEVRLWLSLRLRALGRAGQGDR